MFFRKVFALMVCLSLLVVPAFATAGCGGGVPASAVSPLSASFGEVARDSSSTAETITVTNAGDSDLVIGNIGLVGVDADQFAITSDNVSGQTLEPGGSATVQVVFSPTSYGDKSATLSVSSTDPDPANNPIDVSLSGEGTVSATVLAEIEAKWETSPMNFAYDLARGVNSTCGRCKNPEFWKPDIYKSPVLNCMACKRPTDAVTPDATPWDDFIPEDEWNGISCMVCHPVSADGTVSPTLGLLNMSPTYPNPGWEDEFYTDVILATIDAAVDVPAAYRYWWKEGDEIGKFYVPSGIMSWDPIRESTNELCQGCHTDSEGGSKHMVLVGGPAMSTQLGGVRRPYYCTDCHDPHAPQLVKCTDCHTDLSNIVGHDADHANVDCTTCHDYGVSYSSQYIGYGTSLSSNARTYMQYGFRPGTNEFTGGINASMVTGYFIPTSFGNWTDISSHMLIKKPPVHPTVITTSGVLVKKPSGATYCWNCHYDGNPWGLSIQK
jgi:hypothetical protein